jgi:DNA-binding GntR family transcriptional regulator
MNRYLGGIARRATMSETGFVLPPAATSTRAEHVYATLKTEILGGVLRPAARLRVVELADRFSVSQTVVREALTRLAEQRIVEATPQQGYRVMPLTLADLTALTEVRVHIEGLALRLAVVRGDVSWETEVVATHHQLTRTAPLTQDGAVRPAWLDAHEAFHASLSAGCANDRLLHVASNLRDAAALYRIWSQPLGNDQERDLPSEHRGLLEAVLARDSELAAERLAQHIQRTSAVLVAVAERDEKS